MAILKLGVFLGLAIACAAEMWFALGVGPGQRPALDRLPGPLVGETSAGVVVDGAPLRPRYRGSSSA